MNILSRRSVLQIAAGGACAALGASPSLASSLAGLGRIAAALPAMANGAHLRLFLERPDELALAGLMSMRAGRGAFGAYGADAFFLAAYLKQPSAAHQAAAPASDWASSKIAPTSPGGLAPEEYLCRYVLNAPCEDFVGFTVDKRLASGADRRPWQTNVDLRAETVGMRWTSANLNHPWFAGSRWIPADEGNGRLVRARIIAELRRAAAIA